MLTRRPNGRCASLSRDRTATGSHLGEAARRAYTDSWPSVGRAAKRTPRSPGSAWPAQRRSRRRLRSARDVRKTITVVFSDLVGSTALGEQLDPESLRLVMDRYFAEMGAILERHGGTVEKFIGDAVMAVFGIPVVHEDDALRAVRAAAEMRDALTPLNDELERERGVRIQVRVGVNTGEVVAGDPSGGQRFATGDAVNIAARLEQAAAAGRDPGRREHLPPRARCRHGRARRAACPQGQGPGRRGGSAPRPSRVSRADGSARPSSDATTSSSSSLRRSTGSSTSGRAGWSPCSDPRASASRVSRRSSSPGGPARRRSCAAAASPTGKASPSGRSRVWLPQAAGLPWPRAAAVGAEEVRSAWSPRPPD